ncbi:MAG: hypothetical protein J0647_11790 [Campylobacteraceae bacterium]|nr:hypothetical protein [Campylobacteraceae bacterium]
MKTKVNDIPAYTPKNKDKISVNQFDLQGHYVETFPSITEAAKETGATASGIWMCINFKARSANNSQWRRG